MSLEVLPNALLGVRLALRFWATPVIAGTSVLFHEAEKLLRVVLVWWKLWGLLLVV